MIKRFQKISSKFLKKRKRKYFRKYW
jgi:hypothetical protein